MSFLRTLIFDHESIAAACLVLAMVVAVGHALGSFSVRGIKLGTAGVLFAGLFFGHFGVTVGHTVLDFAREFGLVLFVYSLGLTVGPGFVNALRAEGVRLNLLALGLVLLGTMITVGTVVWGGVPAPAAVGLYSGAVTNTPSLAAASQSLRETQTEATDLPGVGYALAYPFGVVGIILAMTLLRFFTGVDPAQEAEELAQRERHAPPERRTIRVANANLDGVPLSELPIDSLDIVVSRVARGDAMHLARSEFPLRLGDLLLVVGADTDLKKFTMIVGEAAAIDLVDRPGPLTNRRLTITKRKIAGSTVGRLETELGHQIQITRVIRSDIELPASRGIVLQLGDRIHVVGEQEAVAEAARRVGDTPKQLERPEMTSLFLGIALGIVIGSIPIPLPGLPAPVRLGLAGGPLLTAIVLARLHRVGPFVWYLPTAGNTALRELGIGLFLAAVGLKSGAGFLERAASATGIYWMFLGAAITVIPLLVTGFIAHRFLKMGLVPILGLLAGSMTDPPALAFAQGQAKSELPTVTYAAVYPLAMILRILTAQLLVLGLT